jgi:hypothetical protein
MNARADVTSVSCPRRLRRREPSSRALWTISGKSSTAMKTLLSTENTWCST